MTRTIDAHHHFWKTELQEQPWRTEAHTKLERDFEYADLIPDLDAAGVDATVLMQSVDEPAENDRLARYAAEERIAGVVGWLPIRDVRAARSELDRMRIAKLSGVRCLISDDPLEWLTERTSLELFRAVADAGLAWDVVPITIQQTAQVIALSRAVPNLRVVVDHLGRPPLDSRGWEPWATQVHQLSLSPNVAMKVSVGIDALTAWQDWDAGELERYIGYVCEQFGANRLMLASNWPVVLLRASYSRAWSDLTALATTVLATPEERVDLMGATAERWYRLDLNR